MTTEYKQCPLCKATVKAEELQGKQKLCEICRLFIQKSLDGELDE